jgi:P27 family predicted phage terminase small subunit
VPRRQAAALKVVTGRGRDADGVARDKAGRPVNEGPTFARLIPQAPGHLTPEELEVWEELTEELGRLKLTKPLDGPTLVAYVTAYSRLLGARRVLQEEGLIIDGPRGRQAHPAVKVAEVAGAQVVRFATELGATPASEQRLPGGPKKGDDGPAPFDPE